MNTATTILPAMRYFDHFWAEIAPTEHVVQLYTSCDIFIESLERFVGNGIQQGEGVIVIATGAHICALNDRLKMRGFNIEAALLKRQYIFLDAEQTLAKFMVDDLPDEKLFKQLIGDLLTQAGQNGQRVRAFGEMIAILWANGYIDATRQLEEMWQELCQKNLLSLFWAYPKSGFTRNIEASMMEICKTHSKVV